MGNKLKINRRSSLLSRGVDQLRTLLYSKGRIYEQGRSKCMYTISGIFKNNYGKVRAELGFFKPLVVSIIYSLYPLQYNLGGYFLLFGLRIWSHLQRVVATEVVSLSSNTRNGVREKRTRRKTNQSVIASVDNNCHGRKQTQTIAWIHILKRLALVTH